MMVQEEEEDLPGHQEEIDILVLQEGEGLQEEILEVLETIGAEKDLLKDQAIVIDLEADLAIEKDQDLQMKIEAIKNDHFLHHQRSLNQITGKTAQKIP
jgi:hypothetical protein